MSLKAFHIAFVSVCLLLGIFLILQSKIAWLGGVILVLLIPYGLWFLKKMKKIVPALLLVLLPTAFEKTVWACSVCFGDADSLMRRSTKIGMLFMGGLIATVLAAIAGIAISWSRRARHNI